MGVSRSSYYYKKIDKKYNAELDNEVIKIFNDSRKIYGTRKIKENLKIKASRRKIGLIMAKYNLVSKYTLKRYKCHKTNVNEDIIANEVNREFNNRTPFEVVVSDLTYVRVGNKWNYICTIIDLHNREIIGFSVGKNKNSELVKRAFYRIRRPLNEINIFHTDRGSEFKNKAIDEIINTFKIKRSLSHKGCPYDNAVAESTYNIIKTEFVFGESFSSLDELEFKFFDYVNWYNNKRIHGSLGYLSPVDYKLKYIG